VAFEGFMTALESSKRAFGAGRCSAFVRKAINQLLLASDVNPDRADVPISLSKTLLEAGFTIGH
jgi:hypothetical protein